MANAPQLRWTSAARTDVGLVRGNNEDAILNRPERRLWAVADGMGGHAYGEVASGMAVEALDALAPAPDLREAVQAAEASLKAVNAALLATAVQRQVPVIGTTLVLLLASERLATCVWAGDSRIYLCRGGGMHQLTRDHNLAEELRAAGQLAADASAIQGGAMVTRALGAGPMLQLDETELQVSDGDVFLLCSDGLSNAVGPDVMYRALTGGDCRQAVDVLVDAALAAGGRDNISVIVVRADDADADDTVLNPSV